MQEPTIPYQTHQGIKGMSELTVSILVIQIILFLVLFLVVYFAVGLFIFTVKWIKMALNWLLPPLNDS
jgi:hypothetical protein